MRKLSGWAKLNPWKARLLIVALYVPLNFMAVAWGIMLSDSSFNFPNTTLVVVCILTLVLLQLRIQFMRRHHDSYRIRKSIDFAMLALTFFTVAYVSSDRTSPQHIVSPAYSLQLKLQTTSKNIDHNLHGQSKVKPGKERTSLIKKFLRKAVKFYFKRNDTEKALLIAASVLIALALLVLLAALACSIACSGAELLALLVFILGTAGIVFLLIFVINRITRRKPKAPPPVEEVRSIFLP